VLVTSRRVLHVYGEHLFNVPPLDVPNLNVLPNTTLLCKYSAIQLFMERVQAMIQDIVLSPENGPIIAQVCVRLEGLPLALELAAARVKMLSLEQLLEQLLEAGLPVLIGGAKNLPWKLQTLRNSFEWSFALLSPAEQQSLIRLGVFSGGWSLEGAKAMMQYWDAVGEVTEQRATTIGAYKASSIPVSDMLESLVDKSLLVCQKMVGGQVRFTMLETLREYVLA
jgi:predicted ATPase